MADRDRGSWRDTSRAAWSVCRARSRHARCHGGRRARPRWCRPSSARPKYKRRISACCSGVIMVRLRGHATDRQGGGGATRFRGHRPYSATRPPGARSAIDPSTCQRAVWWTTPRAGKSDPSRGRDTPVGDPDDRGDLPGCADGAGVLRGSRRGGRPCDTPTSNRHGLDHTTRRSRRGGCSAGRFSGEAACPRRRSGIAFRLDTARKPWHKRND
jgi:hypothetical protein